MIHREESGLSSLCWSPSRPALLAAATLDGCLLLHDLRAAAVINNSSSTSASASAATEVTRTLRASENYRPKTAAARGSATVSLTAVAFSKSGAAAANMAAATDSLGRTHVWRLDSESAVARPSEIGVLDRFAAAQAEE